MGGVIRSDLPTIKSIAAEAIDTADRPFLAKQGTGVLLTVGNAQVVVDNVTVAQMSDPANFLF